MWQLSSIIISFWYRFKLEWLARSGSSFTGKKSTAGRWNIRDLFWCRTFAEISLLGRISPDIMPEKHTPVTMSASPKNETSSVGKTTSHLQDRCWVIPLAAAAVTFLTAIIESNRGYLYVLFMEEYQVDHATASWPANILLSASHLSGIKHFTFVFSLREQIIKWCFLNTMINTLVYFCVHWSSEARLLNS